MTGHARAILAGGCFWCTQAAIENVPGVISAISGYTGGHVAKPSYDEVCRGTTGHYEALEVIFDPLQVTYTELLAVFWRNIDPTDEDGQFADRGQQYHTAIFYVNDEQTRLAENFKAQVALELGKEIATKILPAQEFYPAEDSHQQYAQKHPIGYSLYYEGSGRKRKLKEIWGK